MKIDARGLRIIEEFEDAVGAFTLKNTFKRAYTQQEHHEREQTRQQAYNNLIKYIEQRLE